MRSRLVLSGAISVVVVGLVSAFPPIVERLSPPAGLTRTMFTQVGFAGIPNDAYTSEINLRFLDEQPDLPRQNFSARWRGFFYLPEAQTVEFFAGGNDEVELQVNGEVLITRNLREGMRTIGRSVSLDAGAHAIAIDYQQFGGSMALNIQRSIDGQPPSPFRPAELFSGRVTALHIWSLSAAHTIRRITPYAWLALVVLLIGAYARLNFDAWRAAGAPRSVREYAKRIWPFTVPALMAPAVLFALGPHTIFGNNTAEFAVQYGELAVPWLLRTVAINWVVLFGIGCALAVISERPSRMYAAVLLALGLLLWGQGNLWNADYGVLAGQDIDLSEHAWRAPYELAAWGIIPALAAVFFRPVSHIAPFAAMAFLGVQGVAVAFAGAESTTPQRVRWIEPPRELFQFSSSRNVIHIVLDEFQSDLFHDIFERDRAVLDRQFSGFQYFVDHAGSFPTTSFSMPAMLTGQEYRNQKPAPEFVREVFKQSSVFETVARNGYDIDATSIVPIDSFEQWLGSESAPNWQGARFRIRKPYVSRDDYREVTARQLLELSLFRHVPHTAKTFSIRRPDTFYRPIWMDRTESPAQVRQHEASNSVAFLEHFVSQMSVGRDRPVYKLIHVGVPHRPIVVNRNCEFLGVVPISRVSYGDQSRCAVKLVAALLNRARELGIYDSSLIIVSSDHGTDLNPWGFNGESDTLVSATRGPAIPRLAAIAGTAKALMLIKPPNRTGAITVSEAPTSHIDFYPTLMDLLGLPDAHAGTSMFRRDATQARTRSYGMYDVRQRFPKQYLDRIHVLSIDRKVVDAAGWSTTETAWPPTFTLATGTIDFLTPGSHLYLGAGWSMDRQESAGESGRVTFVQPLTKRAVLFVPADARELVLRARSSRPGTLAVNVAGRTAEPLTILPDSYRDYSIRIAPLPPRSTSTITLTFDGLADAGRTFKLDRIVVR
jgi:hypothetical protein